MSRASSSLLVFRAAIARRQVPAVSRAQSTSAVWEAARKARESARKLSALSNEERSDALERMAAALENAKADIEKANKADCEKAATPEAKVAAPLQARLKFGGAKLRDTITGVRDLKKLTDPIGQVQLHKELSPGLTMKRVTVPLGVLGIIFEARPDAAIQIASLGVKSGNGVLLKCGREAVASCQAIVGAIKDGLSTSKVSPDVIALLTTREETAEMLKMKEYIDLIIPRGSNEFVQYVMNNTDIAVLGHADGICHTYVDKKADLSMALEIASDAKIQYPSACNAMETLLVHKDVAAAFFPKYAERCKKDGVEVRGCPATVKALQCRAIEKEADWATEYSDKIAACKVVNDVEEAIQHINRFGSRHTDVIVTEDAKVAAHFQSQVDAAGVYWNCSSRFADGFRYGFGAEVGISTSMMPPRGPVGLEGLVTYRYYLSSTSGHVVKDFAGETPAKKYTHKDLSR
jgi:glutamate-5-semialdehyde dehydrogenase